MFIHYLKLKSTALQIVTSDDVNVSTLQDMAFIVTGPPSTATKNDMYLCSNKT